MGSSASTSARVARVNVEVGEPRRALSSSSGDMSSSPQLCSAECAVDGDFSQSGLEDGEFMVVEPLDE